ncbi:MAG TPA: hypothetical protein VMO47_06545, partial [Rhodothermales bacterium]|nr:hypothetical protein [Rhodothermales bacterium]
MTVSCMKTLTFAQRTVAAGPYRSRPQLPRKQAPQMWTASSSKVAGARTTLAFGVLVAGLLWSGPAHSGPIPVPGRGPIPAADAGRGEANCSIHFRARNTLAEDVWVLFSSSHWSTDERDGVTQAVFDGSNFRDIGDRRISPGDRLVEANTSRAGSCALERDFFIEVKFGTFDAGFGAAPVGESVTLHRETGHAGVGVVRGEASGELLLIVDLGESACWAALRPADTTVDNPMVGCEPDEEEEEPVQADSLIRITNLRSGLVCEEGSGEVGRPPSDRICRAHEISVRGRDT